jgi:four helix bundle protein
MGDYQRLGVWQDAHQLVLSVYRSTSGFPAAERYVLTSQIRRVAISIAANIAEGCGRNRDGEFAQFIGIALGSANELDYLLAVARDLGFIDHATSGSCSIALASIRSRLAALQRRLRSAPEKPRLKR